MLSPLNSYESSHAFTTQGSCSLQTFVEILHSCGRHMHFGHIAASLYAKWPHTNSKLQAPVYDILPPTPAIVDRGHDPRHGSWNDPIYLV